MLSDGGSEASMLSSSLSVGVELSVSAIDSESTLGGASVRLNHWGLELGTSQCCALG